MGFPLVYFLVLLNIFQTDQFLFYTMLPLFLLKPVYPLTVHHLRDTIPLKVNTAHRLKAMAEVCTLSDFYFLWGFFVLIIVVFI